ncbi:relaxase/mobilization nuclease domain-containing protein [Sphingobacterium cellulitidis]|nr:relaxase/mobilization nuclease domain-containing protein [Sphingobacterium soli]MBA8986164.1 hypothetical protein [Sphingobacterium soli]
MVAVIKTGSSIRRIFLYNENKVELGLANCISAVNYPMEAHEMTSSMRLKRLMDQAELNSRVSRNSVHISLNFDPNEKDLSDNRLIEIAKFYMQGIGFSEQPYLIYKHMDAAHPHIHLVSTKVRSDGSRIDMHNIGRNQSENIRCLIEKKFNLVQASDSKRQLLHIPKTIDLSKIKYGRTETRGAIQNVLEEVLNSYNFSSLQQLNAILRQYNVLADRGSEGSRIYTNNGLIYRLLENQGQKVGVPIKASAFYSKPTLMNLKERFEKNQGFRKQLKVRTAYAIDKAIQGHFKDMEEFRDRLQKQAIHLVLRQNASGAVYGITYVDHKNRCVFNGSELGKHYSAKAILERVEVKGQHVEYLRLNTALYIKREVRQRKFEPYQIIGGISDSAKILWVDRPPLDALFHVPFSTDYISNAFKKRKKKKKKIGY